MQNWSGVLKGSDKFLPVILFFTFYSGVAMAIEEPKYTVELKKEDYEVRRYEKTIVAETLIDGGFEDSGNRAFRILADYIFGNNRAKTKIEMTAPVSQFEKIEMTAPVSMSRAGNGYVVQFTMPEKFTMETLPEPVDSRVKIRLIPHRKVAVYSYSGSWSEERYQEKLSAFRKLLEQDRVQTVGEPVFARFNSPFMPWFLRRNEIWIEIR